MLVIENLEKSLANLEKSTMQTKINAVWNSGIPR